VAALPPLFVAVAAALASLLVFPQQFLYSMGLTWWSR